MSAHFYGERRSEWDETDEKIVYLNELLGYNSTAVIDKDSKFAKDIIDLFKANYDLTSYYIDIPNFYNLAKPKDATSKLLPPTSSNSFISNMTATWLGRKSCFRVLQHSKWKHGENSWAFPLILPEKTWFFQRFYNHDRIEKKLDGKGHSPEKYYEKFSNLTWDKFT